MDDDGEVSETSELTKNDVINKLFNGDCEISLVAPEKFKSPIWERFRLVFWKGVKLQFVQCVGCKLVLVYKSRTGTASLLRHRCQTFPMSVYDHKLENSKAAAAAAAQDYDVADILNEMASRQFTHDHLELKQETTSDDENNHINGLVSEYENKSYEVQDYVNQTDQGLLQSFSLLEKSFMTGEEILLSREEIELKYRKQDPDLVFERPRNHRHSDTWDRFEIVYYRDIRQNFAKCLSCNSIVSYKKTTGTASLIRHKCKAMKVDNANPISESLVELLRAKVTPQPSSTVNIATSSTSSGKTLNMPFMTTRSINNHQKVPPFNDAAKNLALKQVHCLSRGLISTEILDDPVYLRFLQSLVDFGAENGKRKVGDLINRKSICDEIIPKKCSDVKKLLKDAMSEADFTVSYHKWTNSKNESFVTAFGYFFTQQFDYWSTALGTKPLNESTVTNVVQEILADYKTNEKMHIKCIHGEKIRGFENYQCIIGQISKIIQTSIEASNASTEFYKNIYKIAHKCLNIPLKNYKDTNNDIRMKIFYDFHLLLKSNEVGNFTNQETDLIENFKKLLDLLFSAITSLTNTDGPSRTVTANEVYLWCKKFLKYYSNSCFDDTITESIRKSLLESIKLNFTGKIKELYQIAVFLDPNFKNLKFLEPNERVVLLDIVRNNLQKIISEEEEDDENLTSSAAKKIKTENTSKSQLAESFLEFMDITMESVEDKVNSEIQCYMGFKLEEPIGIVEFWKHTDSFKYLKKLARNLLSLPACTFHSNCCFLSTSESFYSKCQHLSTEDVQHLTFLHQNFEFR